MSRAVHPLTVGAIGTCAGISLSLTGPNGAGALLTLAGLGMLLYGLHRFGRLGADPPRGAGPVGSRGE